MGRSSRRNATIRSAPAEILHSSVRGSVAALSMSGFRNLSVNLGFLGTTPPELVVQHSGGERWFGKLSGARRQGAVELLHCAYGTVGGMVFGALPERWRRQRWVGPAYGVALWMGFETVIAPGLGLPTFPLRSPSDRLALALDHLLYGFVLSELRRHPRI